MASRIKAWNTYLGKGKIVGFMNEKVINFPKLEQGCTGFPQNEPERLAGIIDKISRGYRFLKCSLSEFEIISLLKNSTQRSLPLEISPPASLRSKKIDLNPLIPNEIQPEMPLKVRVYSFEKGCGIFDYLSSRSYSVKIQGERGFLIVKDERVVVYHFEEFFKIMSRIFRN